MPAGQQQAGNRKAAGAGGGAEARHVGRLKEATKMWARVLGCVRPCSKKYDTCRRVSGSGPANSRVTAKA